MTLFNSFQPWKIDVVDVLSYADFMDIIHKISVAESI